MPQLIETIVTLEARGVGFQSLTESIDITTPGGRLIFHVFGALGQFERDLIRDHTKAGWTAAAARGRKKGPQAGHDRRQVAAGAGTYRQRAARPGGCDAAQSGQDSPVRSNG